MSNWISVEDELPELGASVLIYWRPVDWEKRPYHREIMAAGYSNSDGDDEPYFWVMRKYDTATYVTHWMQLPEPPEEDKQTRTTIPTDATRVRNVVTGETIEIK